MQTSGSIEIGNLMGYKNSTEFEIYYKRVKRPHAPMTDEKKNQLIPETLRPYIDVMVRSNENLKKLCKRILQEEEQS